MGLFKFLNRIFESKTLFLGSGRRTIGYQTGELYNSALWSCVVNLSRLYATLPWHAFAVDRKGNRNEDKKSLLALLLNKPNQYMTSYDFRFVMGFNFEMHGEACAIIKRSTNGLPIALYPVSPNALIASWEGSTLYYTLAVSGEKYSANDVLLIRNTPIGYGKGTVLNPVQYAANDIDLEQKCKDLQKQYYDGATVVGNIISVPDRTTDEAKDKLKQIFDSSRGFRNYVLSESIKLTPIQIQNADIQKLSEAQKWNALEVARRFNVPPFFIGDTTGTYNNSEQQGMQMVIYCLNPRITAWETALNASLCQEKQYIKFSLEGLMRGDHSTRSAFYHNAIMDGWMSINDVRTLEDLPSIGADGDKHFFPMNYGTLSDIVAGKYAQGAGTGLNIWDIPAGGDNSKKEDAGSQYNLREIRRQKDLKYVEKAKSPAKTNRQKIEALIRKQLNVAIAELRMMVATGAPTDTVISDFKTFLDSLAKDYSPQYREIYLDILKKMVPVIQKETGKDDAISDDVLDKYAGTYADSMSGRISGKAGSVAESSVGTEEFDSTMDSLQNDYPIEQSEEEVNRSSNAFSLFLFQQFHVTVFHVVAASNSCSFCQTVDGKTASVDGYILTKDDDVDTGNGIRHIQKNYRHPPFHGHCKCTIAPGEGY